MVHHALKSKRWLISLSVLLVVGTQEIHAQAIAIKTIALDGDSNLSTGDPVIGVGGNVAIDSLGKVMFFVTMERNGDTSTRTVNVATSNGTTTTVLPDFDFLDFQKPKPILNAAGTVAFSWFEGTAAGSRNGIFIGANLGNLGFIAADSLALPGSTGNNVFVIAGRPALNSSGVVTFATGFTSAGNQPMEPTNGIFFGTSSGAMTRIVLAGEQANGTAVGTVFSSVSAPIINDRGDIAFFGRLQLAASEVGIQGETGIWLYLSQTGQVQLVVRAGETLLPGMEAGSNFIGITGGGFSIGPNGDVLFEATFQPPRFVPSTQMWRGSSPDTLVPLFGVAKPNSLGFDAGPTVDTDVVFTSAGDLVFQSGSIRVVGGAIQQQTRVVNAIWKDTGAFLEVIMHVGTGPVGAESPGSDAPGTSGTFRGFPTFTANGAGSVAFISQYEIGGAIQGRGLWAQDSDGVLQLVALEGEPIMTRDGMKTVTGLTLLAGPGNVGGFSSSYNDRFELAFTAIFDDSSSGIFRASIGDVPPLPPSMGEEFFWNRGCSDDNWHTICANMTNWLDMDNQPQTMPPGASGDEIVTIAMNSSAGVTLDQQDAQIGKLTANGMLIVRKALTLNQPSSVESLILDSLESQIIANDTLTLTGDETVFQAGTITINGDDGIINEGTVTVEPFALTLPTALAASISGVDEVSKSRQAQMQAQPMPPITFAGDKVWFNRARATFLQLSDIFVKDHIGQAAILNGKDSAWTIEKGSILVGSEGEVPKFINVGLLTKIAMVSTDESFIDLAFELKPDGSVVVEDGTLTLRGGGSFEEASGIASTFLLKSDTSTLRLGSQPSVNRTLYQVLSGTVNATSAEGLTTPVFAVDDDALLSISDGAQFRTALPASLDRSRGGFELNGGDILAAGVFRNDKIFTWRGGTISTPILTDDNSLNNNVFINTDKLSIEGNTRKTLAGLLINAGVLSLKTRAAGPSTLTIDNGILVNRRSMSLEEGSMLLAGAGGGLLGNDIFADILVFPTEAAGANSTVTIATKLDNLGKITVRAFDDNRKISLKLTGSIVQLKSTTLTGGEWAINGGDLDLNGKVINQLGESTGERALVSLENGGTFPALQLQTIEKKGTLLLGSAQSLAFPGSLTNKGTMQVGGFRGGFNLSMSSITIAGQFDQFGHLVVGSGNRLEVRNGTMFLQPGSKTQIDGTVAIFQDGGNDLRLLPGSVLKGSGTINSAKITQINAAAQNQGKSVIGPGTSPGILTFEADFEQTPGGILEIEIGGTNIGINQDQLIINGNAEIAGTLVLKFIDDFSPSTGQTFDFLSVSGTQTGDFERVEIVDLAAGFEFEVSPTDTGFTMTALSDGMFTGIPGEINEVNLGFNTPEAETSASPGDMNVPMLQFEVVPEADGLSITGLTLSASGSGDDALDLTDVTVWLDEDGNGSVGFEELSIGVGLYNADNGTLNLTLDPPLEVAGRETVTLLVTYNISDAEAATGAKMVSVVPDMHDNSKTSASRSTVVPVALLVLPLIVGLGLVTRRKPKAFAWCGLTLAMTVWITGCPMPGSGPGTQPISVTYQATLTAINATETGTDADASVANLSLAGTTLTVLR